MVTQFFLSGIIWKFCTYFLNLNIFIDYLQNNKFFDIETCIKVGIFHEICLKFVKNLKFDVLFNDS